jgi:hypothetical protein
MGKRRTKMEGTPPVAPRRKGTTAVHSLHRFVFSVPDLKAAVDFYATILDAARDRRLVDL